MKIPPNAVVTFEFATDALGEFSHPTDGWILVNGERFHFPAKDLKQVDVEIKAAINTEETPRSKDPETPALRDHFANTHAKFERAINQEDFDKIAAHSYRAADALLKARQA